MTSAHAYVRVSSRAQDDAMQRGVIVRFAEKREEAIPPEAWYAESRSAKTMQRPELARLREDARLGLVKTLYVFKLDRLCRTGVSDTFAVIKELHQAGVTVIAIADNLILKPGGDDIHTEVFIFALWLAAKLERTAINDRIAGAREGMKREGRPWGRPRRMSPSQLEEARALAAAGRSQRSIAMALKVPKSTIADALAAPAAPEKHVPEEGASGAEKPDGHEG